MENQLMGDALAVTQAASLFQAAQSSSLMHGSSGLVLAYTAVQASMLVGMLRGKAQLRQLVLSPFIAAPVTALVGVGMAVASPLLKSRGLHGWGFTSASLLQLAAGTALSVGLGYVSGLRAARGLGTSRAYQRGTVIADPEPQTRSRGASSDRAHSTERAVQPLRLADIDVAALDETKHFKLIGTTGTGKSTAIRELLRGALARGDRAVIADPDGGYLERVTAAPQAAVLRVATTTMRDAAGRVWKLWRHGQPSAVVSARSHDDGAASSVRASSPRQGLDHEL
jgi:Type IV secretion-system coupling protein DNA-binding domain